MREGEAVLKELSRLASRAILYRLPGLALDLQAAGSRLGDALATGTKCRVAAKPTCAEWAKGRNSNRCLRFAWLRSWHCACTRLERITLCDTREVTNRGS